ncbi:hypothetical protein HMN09_00715000 [Mycena chlorophos]|uniref:Uncharacterized protein n=1 Tax=Mycena chlorophos TaxID=658473 RepID=A0A8H6WA10_MYCCL|nr:hypothetical protein HMN09_00715000 [Mycena chlorophos]
MAPNRVPSIPATQLAAYQAEFPAQSAVFAATLGVAVAQPLNPNDPPVLGVQAAGIAKLLVHAAGSRFEPAHIAYSTHDKVIVNHIHSLKNKTTQVAQNFLTAHGHSEYPAEFKALVKSIDRLLRMSHALLRLLLYDEIDDFLDKSDDDVEANASSQDTQDAEGEEDTEMPEAPPVREPSPELQPPAKKQKLPKFQKNKSKSSSKNDSIELVVEDAAKTVDAMETGVTGPHTQQHDGIGIEVVQLARLIYQAVSVNTHSTKQIRYEELMQEEERLNSAVVLSVQRLGFGVEEFLAARSRHTAILNRLANMNFVPPNRISVRHLLFVTDYPLIEISVRDLNYGLPTVVVQAFLANRDNRLRPVPIVEVVKRTPTGPKKSSSSKRS